MVTKFFIYSAGRTMTAWLSIYLSLIGNRLVTHEILPRNPDKILSESLWGNIGSDNLLFVPYILREFPQAKHILLNQNLDEVITTMMNKGITLSKSQLKAIEAKIAGLKAMEPRLVTLDFQEDKLELSRQICYHLDVEFDEGLAKELLRFNIQLEKLDWEASYD